MESLRIPFGIELRGRTMPVLHEAFFATVTRKSSFLRKSRLSTSQTLGGRNRNGRRNSQLRLPFTWRLHSFARIQEPTNQEPQLSPAYIIMNAQACAALEILHLSWQLFRAVAICSIQEAVRPAPSIYVTRGRGVRSRTYKWQEAVCGSPDGMGRHLYADISLWNRCHKELLLFAAIEGGYTRVSRYVVGCGQVCLVTPVDLRVAVPFSPGYVLEIVSDRTELDGEAVGTQCCRQSLRKLRITINGGRIHDFQKGLVYLEQPINTYRQSFLSSVLVRRLPSSSESLGVSIFARLLSQSSHFAIGDCQTSDCGGIYITGVLAQNLHIEGGTRWNVLAHDLKSHTPPAGWDSDVSPAQLSSIPRRPGPPAGLDSDVSLAQLSSIPRRPGPPAGWDSDVSPAQLSSIPRRPGPPAGWDSDVSLAQLSSIPRRPGPPAGWDSDVSLAQLSSIPRRPGPPAGWDSDVSPAQLSSIPRRPGDKPAVLYCVARGNLRTEKNGEDSATRNGNLRGLNGILDREQTVYRPLYHEQPISIHGSWSVCRASGVRWIELGGSEVLRADACDVSAGMQGRRKREISEKTRRLAPSSGTVLTCKNPGATPPGLEPGSPCWEVSSLDYYSTAETSGPITQCPAYLKVFPAFVIEKRVRDKGDTATHIKCPIAAKRKALYCRAVFF
ncbi:hypothetical protein PR048_026413 [Dryococelus australis]|uniref:Uncharacterized protein n=1 Tax=Dryococelus australis TaxID=614101 RepID=A0ABQ9GLB9_9NEOP|nr:hypothetical protein PR048_026413 [Dryococelus australis]